MHKCEGCGQRCLCDGEEYDWYAAPVDCQCSHKSVLAWGSDPSVPWLKEDVVNTMVEAQRLSDAVIDAAIDWHKSDMDESMDAAQTLEDAIEALMEFRRKMPIVKSR